jgi:adenylate kinase family enzyme
MRRVLVIGISGAGKSTFARELARRTGLPLIHLDKEFWRPGWTTTPLPEWRAKVEALAARDAWIMDGNYGATLDLRLPRADAVIWFDYLRLRCLRQIAWRIATTYGRVRPDLAPGCPEQIDLEFLRFV